MFWRFLIADDLTVDRFLIRDADSRYLFTIAASIHFDRFSMRELHAVNEWIASGKQLHVMRDHPYHGVAMLVLLTILCSLHNLL